MIGAIWKTQRALKIKMLLSGESGKKGSMEEEAFGIDLGGDGNDFTARRESMRTYMKTDR